MVVLKGTFEIPLDDLAAVQAEVATHIALTQGEPGCVSFELRLVEGAENIYQVFEQFDSRASFEAHQQRVKNSKWGQVTHRCVRNYSVQDV